MSARRGACARAGFIALVGLVSCSVETVVVAQLDGAGTGGSGSGIGSSSISTAGSGTGGDAGAGGSSVGLDCASSEDCQPGDICAKEACDAPLGRCEHRPTTCSAAVVPVCGCDGINYLNDCLRRASGVAFATDGECKTGARTCDAEAPCPEFAYCAVLLPGIEQNCDSKATGVCWVVPAECGPPGPGDRFDACDGGATCLDPCRAIKASTPHRRSKDCGR